MNKTYWWKRFKTQKDAIEYLINEVFENDTWNCQVYMKRLWFNDNLYYTVINWKQRNLWKDYNDVEYNCYNSYDFTKI